MYDCESRRTRSLLLRYHHLKELLSALCGVIVTRPPVSTSGILLYALSGRRGYRMQCIPQCLLAANLGNALRA